MHDANDELLQPLRPTNAAQAYWYVVCADDYHSHKYTTMHDAAHAADLLNMAGTCPNTHHVIGKNVVTSLDPPAKDTMSNRHFDRLKDLFQQAQREFNALGSYADQHDGAIADNSGEDEYREFRDKLAAVTTAFDDLDACIDQLELDLNFAVITVSATITATWDATNECWTDFELEVADTIGLTDANGGELLGTGGGDTINDDFHNLTLEVSA